jgi:hypothetical protein
MSDTAELKAALKWLNGNDTGISSQAIMTHMLGEHPTSDTYPSDPSDLGRCIRLLRVIPAWHQRIGEMAKIGHVWASLVTHWDELEMLMSDEVGFDWQKGERAPRTYDRMKSLQLEGLLSDPSLEVKLSKDGTSWTSYGPKHTSKQGEQS